MRAPPVPWPIPDALREALGRQRITFLLPTINAGRSLDANHPRPLHLSLQYVSRHREKIGARHGNMRDIGQLGQTAIAFLHDILHIGRRKHTPSQPAPQVTFMGQNFPCYPSGERVAFRRFSPLSLPRAMEEAFPSLWKHFIHGGRQMRRRTQPSRTFEAMPLA